ncbi:hypothetical protein [Actinocorallia longicatena]|uniref:hypothetical protein n=1 Tax=Actinocorallia longicatena TaxID=111803 RepID=UPI0031CDC0E8
MIIVASEIAPHGDPWACRWIALRHADDHIQLVATLARQDGRWPDASVTTGSKIRVACRTAEDAFGLTKTS